MTKLSVVVIIYGVEKYLRKCIESILRQSFKEFELILVDDGSQDECPRICDEYAQKDFRIKVIHQKNQGSVMARWNGLSAASGAYISFIDGDDWLDADMYEHMMYLADQNESDMVIVGYKEETEKGCVKKRNALDSGFYKDERMLEVFNKALYTGKYYQPGIVAALWNKIFKRSLFFEGYNPPNPIIRMGDDAAVSYPMISKTKSLIIDNEFCPYHYRVAEGSMSRTYDERYFERCLALLDGLNNNLAENRIMLEKLKFYSLFIIEIGILRVFSRETKVSILRKIIMVREFQRRYKYLNINSCYEWDKIVNKNKKWLECFIDGNICKMVIHLYMRKGLNRLERVYEKKE